MQSTKGWGWGIHIYNILMLILWLISNDFIIEFHFSLDKQLKVLCYHKNLHYWNNNSQQWLFGTIQTPQCFNPSRDLWNGESQPLRFLLYLHVNSISSYYNLFQSAIQCSISKTCALNNTFNFNSDHSIIII
jgi:hypothetical protein